MPVPVESAKMKQEKGERLAEGYQLNTSNDEGFTHRVDSIFGRLDSLEEKHSETVKNYEHQHAKDEDEDDVKEEDDKPCTSSSTSSRTTHEKNGQEFKFDLRNKLKKRKVPPDFVSNTRKWKKYSLEEDGSSHFSNELSADQVNTAVAMELMDELKKRRNSATPTHDQVKDAHVFKVPHVPNKSLLSNKCEQNTVIASSHSSKARCMPTFEFGYNVNKKQQTKTKSSSSSSSELPTQEVVLDYEQQSDEVDQVSKNDDDDEVDDDKPKNVDGSNTLNNCLFICRGKKGNRVIRKQTCEQDVDDE